MNTRSGGGKRDTVDKCEGDYWLHSEEMQNIQASYLPRRSDQVGIFPLFLHFFTVYGC